MDVNIIPINPHNNINIKNNDKTEEAAEGFTAIFLEKMLNSGLEESTEKTIYEKQYQSMLNLELAQKVASSNNPIKNKIIKDLKRE